MLVRTLNKGYTHSLLVGLQTSTATTAVPQKDGNQITSRSSGTYTQ